jgi:hypothetical protein
LQQQIYEFATFFVKKYIPFVRLCDKNSGFFNILISITAIQITIRINPPITQKCPRPPDPMGAIIDSQR